MPIHNPALNQFWKAALRFKQLAGYTSIDIGMVYVQSPAGRFVLTLRGVLSRKPLASRNDYFEADPIFALRGLDSIERLDTLLSELDTGTIRVTGRLDLAIPTETQGGIPWQFQSWSGRASTMVRMSGLPLHKSIPISDKGAIDLLIRKKSDHRIVSLAGLFSRYTDERIADLSTSSSIEIRAPWPLTEIQTSLQDEALLVRLKGLPGLPTDRFILNVENAVGGDPTFKAADLKWQEQQTPGDAESLYSTTIENPGLQPQLVNAYFEGLDEVHLQQTFPMQFVPDVIAEPESEESGAAAPSGLLPSASVDARLIAIDVAGYRSLVHVALDLTLSNLTVVIAENQAGKSSILDALAIVQLASDGRLQDAVQKRGGFHSMVSRFPGSNGIAFQTAFAIGAQRFRYGFQMEAEAPTWSVVRETLEAGDESGWSPLLQATAGVATHRGRELRSTSPRELLLSQPRAIGALPELESIRAALSSIAIYPGFVVGPATRKPEQPQPGARLHPLGSNLIAVLHSMREETPDEWTAFTDIVRLAFPRLRDIRFPPIADGYVNLHWYETGASAPFNASELSDGVLAFLACLAAVFQRGNSIVAIDEPEAHLHPEALYRLVSAARGRAARRPILFTTQSDRLLGFLDDTPEAIVIARRGEQGNELVRPAANDLRAWLQKFSLADIRPELESWGLEG